MLDADCLCDYLGSKYRLTDIFFPNNRHCLIRQNSNTFKEFWSFLQKLQSRIQTRSDGCTDSKMLSHRSFRLNIRTINYRLEDYIRHRHSEKITGRKLTNANMHCFHLIYDMYIDFLQKQKLSRIMKIRRDRAALPIATFRASILDHLSNNSVVVVAGDTGCGKSTQVPQYLLEGELDEFGEPCGKKAFQRIAVTQPRRIACISLASRVSTEMLNEKGTKVGYQVRFERSRTKATQLLFLTEGLLLRQMQTDPFLKEYDALVLDEVHERHWQTDCLLGLVKCLTTVRPDLRVILMSATINVNLFSSYFNGCPIIQVPGRLFPIELKYVPLTQHEIVQSSSSHLDPSPYLRLLQQIDSRYPATERGDLLVFLPGMADIQAIMEQAQEYASQTKRWIILPLHSTLSARDQEKVFHVAPDGVRKCVLSTNIAETSLTIDGIRFVADCGRAKELSWDASARMRCLKEFPISKASADQRKGRAGRTGPGTCFRFYSPEDYDAFEPFSAPEIRRIPLETLILQTMVMGLPDVLRFPFIEPPEIKSLKEALNRLESHGALTKDVNVPCTMSSEQQPPQHLVVTALGRLLADLPVDFAIGRMLITSAMFGVVEPVLSLAAGMAIQSPLLPVTSFHGADLTRRTESLAVFESDHGESFTLLNVFDEWLRIKAESARGSPSDRYKDHGANSDDVDSRPLPGTNLRRWCQRIGAQEQRLHEMVRLRTQFAQLLRDTGLLMDRDSCARRPRVTGTDRRHRELNRARRAERLQTKRRRLLTFQDKVDEEVSNSSSDDESTSTSEAARLRKWLAAAGGSKGSVSAGTVSVRDLELVLCYDLSSLADYASRHGHMTNADLVLLKVILAGGLYPHLALGDAANQYRVANRGGTAGPGAEMVFHTRTKGFVTLHPNDVFVRNPDVLFPDPKRRATNHLTDSEEAMQDTNDTVGGQSSEKKNGPLSSAYADDHQLLMYLDLMETTKPFLINTIRVPALPTLLLYCRQIDTNADATRIVFDAWLEVQLVDTEASQRALATAVWLRTTLDELMNLQLEDCMRRREAAGNDKTLSEQRMHQDEPLEQNASLMHRCRQLRRLLSHSLTAFLAATVGGPHTVRRLLAADVKQLYRKRAAAAVQPPFPVSKHSSERSLSDNIPSSSKTLSTNAVKNESVVKTPHKNTLKGGYDVTSYLTIDSLFPYQSKTGNSSCDESLTDPNEDSFDLALRLLQQTLIHQTSESSGSYLVERACQESLTDIQKKEEEEEEKDCQLPRCDRCGETLRVSKEISLQTALLRHHRHCHPV